MSDSPFGAGTDPEALIAQVERQVLEAEQRAASATQLVQQIEAIEAEGRSRDGDVRVRVDSSGRLTGISFDAAALSLSASQLEVTVLGVAREAQRSAARAAIELAEASLGDGLASQLRGEYESRLGSLDDERQTDQGGDRERRPY